MLVTQRTQLKDTSLWQRLNGSFSGHDRQVAEILAQNLIPICQEAYNRMKRFPSLHPEYTLHDEVHLIRVTELMSKVIPKAVVERLNPVEIALLILSAHYHDQGMVLDGDEIVSLKEKGEFKKFQDNWEIEHPNLGQVRQHLNDGRLSDDERKRHRELEHELNAALLTDYIRKIHGEISAKFVRGTFGGDKRWEVDGINLADFVARLCLSHVQPAKELVPSNGFRYDEVIGQYQVNMVYLGLILRLADILDFDRERTPDELYRTIDFHSNISLNEWEKHRSVEGWVIINTLIQFTMRCEHPEYQRAAYRFIDWIDKELANARDIHRSFPAHVEHYQLDLPSKVDRSRIEPKDDAYIYYDLEFSLSRDEIISLLMTDKLYGSPSLCVRELLQNALDALRYRQALRKCDGDDWLDGKIIMQHELNKQGHEIIRCTDNGAGMDETVVERFLTRVGRSFYRSPEFEQERISFRVAKVDFDPCSQFGIGFMSCFMLGDRINIYTRRDYGPSRGYGTPLIIQVNGLGSIVVIRKGEPNQPIGTTVEIIGRKKPHFLDEWDDQVKLIPMLQGYALACEFPIHAECTIEELAETTTIPPEIAVPRTLMEISNIKMCKTIELDFSDIHALLDGYIRTSFLVNNTGHFVLENAEAGWKPNEELEEQEDRPCLVSSRGDVIKESRDIDNQTCIDGILVAGMPGREERERFIAWRANAIHLYPMYAILDIRGQIKPPLTPARIPPDIFSIRGSHGPRWDYIQMLANRAKGKIWEHVANQLGAELDDETFWQLAVIYGSHNGETEIFHMPANTIWSKIAVPIVFEDKLRRWIPIRSLNAVEVKTSDEKSYQILHGNDGHIGAYETLSKWLSPKRDKHGLEWSIKIIIEIMSTVVIKNGKALLEIRQPTEPNISPWEFVFNDSFSQLILLPYSSEAQEFFSVHMPVQSVNRSHPLVEIAQGARYRESRSDLQKFALSAAWTLSSQETFNDSNSELTYGQIRLGNRYKDVDWSRVDISLHPPYTIRLVTGKVVEITTRDFEHWAKGNPKS